MSNSWRGHILVEKDGITVYQDTLLPVQGNERECGHCGLFNTPEGHDGCLGTIPGAMNACCGHGGLSEGAYIQYEDGSIIRDDEALEVFKQLNLRSDKVQG